MIGDEKIQGWVLTLAAGVVGWLVKDFLFGVLAKRDEDVRREWKEMLTNVWNPLYYWSGIVTYNTGEAGYGGHGVVELEKLLASAVHLIPKNHYRVLVSIVEHCSGLEPRQVHQKDIKATHDFIYGKIMALNYLLYRKPAGYDPMTAGDILSAPKAVLQQMALALMHLSIWLLIVLFLSLPYWLYYYKLYRTSVIAGMVWGLSLIAVWIRDIMLRKDLIKKLRGNV
jgi:hypothetical protein